MLLHLDSLVLFRIAIMVTRSRALSHIVVSAADMSISSAPQSSSVALAVVLVLAIPVGRLDVVSAAEVRCVLDPVDALGPFLTDGRGVVLAHRVVAVGGHEELVLCLVVKVLVHGYTVPAVLEDDV
jgi:hypothetical protein